MIKFTTGLLRNLSGTDYFCYIIPLDSKNPKTRYNHARLHPILAYKRSASFFLMRKLASSISQAC